MNTKKEEVQIRCSCAIGDLSEFARIKPVNKTATKIQKKNLKKTVIKKKNQNNN
jgi:hypothetical protein